MDSSFDPHDTPHLAGYLCFHNVESEIMNCILEPTYRVFAADVEKLVQERYGIKMTVCQSTAHPPGVVLAYRVTPFRSEATGAPIRKGQRTRSILNYLRTLAGDGLIPYGRYVVDTGEPKPIKTTGKWDLGRMTICGISC